MTREDVLSRTPGPELDALVGEIVMGLDMVEGQFSHLPRYYLTDYEKTIHRAVPFYSSDVSAAWAIEEHIAIRNDQGWYVRALCDVVGTPRDGTRTLAMDDWRLLHATPEQRCKAALIAVLNL